MKYFDYLLSFICSTVTVTAIIQTQLAFALTSTEIYNIGQAITVRIEFPLDPDDDPTVKLGGSGIIIKREGYTYTVLTNWHVFVKNDEGIRSGIYRIYPYPNKETGIKVNSNQVRRIGNYDLAVFQFTSLQDYQVAQLGNSDEIVGGENIYFAGYPNPGKVDYERNYNFIPTTIISRLSRPNSKGYALKYGGASAQGMSGGPILNESAKVIGIHGLADIIETGSVGNYAIPINLAKGLIDNAIASIKVYNTPQVKPTPIKHNSITHPQANSTVNSTIKLQTAKADYRKLDQLLASGKWKEADLETWELMKKVTNRETAGWLRIEDYKKFPRQELRILDKLWVKYSNGRFGFSVQKKIWIESGGTPGVWNYDVYKKFADSNGWQKNGETIYYSMYTFNIIAPIGHLPFGRAWLSGVGMTVYIFSLL